MARHDMARRSVASCSRWQERQHNMTQHNVRDPSVYLFVNEGDETGDLIFGLCFPMAPLDVDGPHLEMRESGGQAGHRGVGPAGELGTRTLQLGRQAGYHAT